MYSSGVEVHRITSAQPGASPDLVRRERTYLVMMSIRMVAIVVAVVVPGVWRWVAIALGVLLPYIAVVLVNSARTRGTEDDPNFYVAPPATALADRPFHPGHTEIGTQPAEGRVIPGERL